MNWINVTDKRKPPKRRPLLCYCPEWNETGYQVAIWDGEGFTYPSQPNDGFHKEVVAWAIFMEAD